MLYAWGHHKRRFEHGEYEDEIVSAVFGSLRYLTDSSRNRILKEIIDGAFGELSPLWKINEVKSCSLVFWPNIAKIGRVEPDIEIDVKTSGGDKVILIEAKWNSGLSGDDQLFTQWKHANESYECDVWQIYLTKQPHSLEQMVGNNKNDGHTKCLANVTWSKIASCANSLKMTSGIDYGTKTWVEDVYHFLDSLNQTPFDGFEDLLAGVEQRMWLVSWQYHGILIDVERAIRGSGVGSSFKFHGVWKFERSTSGRTK